MDAPSEPLATPEVEPVTSLLFHPLLQDPVFLAAVGGLILLVLFTGESAPQRLTAQRD
jgi:signal recognition particle receptor subunit beta